MTYSKRLNTKKGDDRLSETDGEQPEPVRSVKMPHVRTPEAGEPLMIALSYSSKAVAERQAAAWNSVLLVDGLEVTVGLRDDKNEWPLIWTEVLQ